MVDEVGGSGVQRPAGGRMRGGRIPAAGIAAAVVALAAAGTGVAFGLSGGGRHHSGASLDAAKAAQLAVPAPRLVALDLHKSRLTVGRHLVLRVTHGTAAQVRVTTALGAVPGRLSSNSTTWTSTAVVVPEARYAVTATMLDARHHPHSARLAVRSGAAPALIYTSIAPLSGGTYGVGEPISVWFTRPVTDRAAAERGLQVHTSTPVAGAWHWFSDTEVHWRPKVYWPSGTKITLDVRLGQTQLAPGFWGHDRSVHFAIGPANISTVDVTGHTMTVTQNGKVLRVLKVSTGRDKYPTLGGVHVALSKQPSIVMDSATVGIPKGSPDYYHETVLWDVRISDGGAFVHSAPWSVQDQGRSNVSHGCVNLSPANAEWFYRLAQIGDVVDIRHAEVGPNRADPGMSDWNLSWSQWLAGSALSG